METETPAVMGRDAFLKRATLALGGLVGALVALPVAGFALLPSFTRTRRAPVDVGPLADFPEGQYMVTTFLIDPTAGAVARRTAYVRNNGLLGTAPSFTVHLEPVHACRLSDPAQRPHLRAAGEDHRHAGEPRLADAGRSRGRLWLPVPRQPVRPRGQPHRRAGSTCPRPLRVLDRQRPPAARRDVQRFARRGHGRASPNPSLRPPRARPARGRPRVVALPGAATAVNSSVGARRRFSAPLLVGSGAAPAGIS